MLLITYIFAYLFLHILTIHVQVHTEEQKLGLWIGANTMVEYTYDEAFELLTGQLAASHLKLAELDEDLGFLRANSITVEVNMARIFNYSVRVKKTLEEQAKAAALTDGSA